eukprot:scaffold442_cov268-Pinguiococcus_pyrenoidosus.AAC.105
MVPSSSVYVRRFSGTTSSSSAMLLAGGLRRSCGGLSAAKTGRASRAIRIASQLHPPRFSLMRTAIPRGGVSETTQLILER